MVRMGRITRGRNSGEDRVENKNLAANIKGCVRGLCYKQDKACVSHIIFLLWVRAYMAQYNAIFVRITSKFCMFCIIYNCKSCSVPNIM